MFVDGTDDTTTNGTWIYLTVNCEYWTVSELSVATDGFYKWVLLCLKLLLVCMSGMVKNCSTGV